MEHAFFFQCEDYRGVCGETETILADVYGNETAFLHEREIAVWTDIRSPVYRRNWLAGRVAVKTLYKERTQIDDGNFWKETRLVSRNPYGKGVPPVLFHRDVAAGESISISHTDRVVLAVLAETPRIGCDLVPDGGVTPEMAKQFFCDEEFAHGFEQRDRYWAAKEAAYKACNEDFAFAPRRWTVSRTENADVLLCRHGDSEPMFVHCDSRFGHVIAIATHRR